VSEGAGFFGEIEEVADENVDEDTEVIGIEVFVGGGGGEKEVQELKGEKL
jgi:hypothetical protein